MGWRETRGVKGEEARWEVYQSKNGKQASFLATRRLGFMGLRCPVHDHDCGPGFVRERVVSFRSRDPLRPFFPLLRHFSSSFSRTTRRVVVCKRRVWTFFNLPCALSGCLDPFRVPVKAVLSSNQNSMNYTLFFFTMLLTWESTVSNDLIF